jgi:hypothetical protein
LKPDSVPSKSHSGDWSCERVAFTSRRLPRSSQRRPRSSRRVILSSERLALKCHSVAHKTHSGSRSCEVVASSTEGVAFRCHRLALRCHSLALQSQRLALPCLGNDSRNGRTTLGASRPARPNRRIDHQDRHALRGTKASIFKVFHSVGRASVCPGVAGRSAGPGRRRDHRAPIRRLATRNLPP